MGAVMRAQHGREEARKAAREPIAPRLMHGRRGMEQVGERVGGQHYCLEQMARSGA